MPEKRVTPEEDYRRLAERVYNEYPQIIDRTTYEQAFKAYMLGTNKPEHVMAKMQNKSFQHLRQMKTGISTQRRLEPKEAKHKLTQGKLTDEALYKLAGGKLTSLARDRQKTANVQPSKIKYVDTGATRADLEGLDTRKEREFKVLGRVKRRIVFARRETVLRNGKAQVKYRSKRGQFVSIKKK